MACIFYCVVIDAMHATLGSPSVAQDLLALLAGLFLPSSLGQWVLADARKRGRALPYDYGTFVFYAFFLFAPLYLFETRGWRAIVPLAWFFLIWITASICGNLPYFLHVSQGQE